MAITANDFFVASIRCAQESPCLNAIWRLTTRMLWRQSATSIRDSALKTIHKFAPPHYWGELRRVGCRSGVAYADH